MTLYVYRAVNDYGAIKKGVLDASSVSDLELRLKHVGLILLQSRPALVSKLSLGAKTKRRELITFFFNLELLTRAGVPLIESLVDLRDTMHLSRFREVVSDMVENIRGGMHLSQAMAMHPQIFGNVTVSLVRAGEESAKLPEIFKHLSDSFKWHDEMASQAKHAMIYPALAAVTIVGLIFFLMLYLVPQLTIFFTELGQSIPPQTKALISVSQFFSHYRYWIIFSPVTAFILLKLAATWSREVRYQIDFFKIRIWVIGPILLKIILARFANTFATMYGAGISVLDGLNISSSIAGNEVVAERILKAKEEIEEGKTLIQSFQNARVFPPLVLRMIKVGEATGKIDESLYNVSYFYERDVKEAIAKMQTMIEPTLSLILGVILGWIILSVITPIYEILGKIR